MNVRDALRELGIPWKEHGQSGLVSSGWLGVECPRCGTGTGKPGLGVHIRTLKCSCWKCGGANLVTALAQITGRPYPAIKALLRGLAPEVWDKEVTHPERGTMKFRTIVETMAGHDGNHLKQLAS